MFVLEIFTPEKKPGYRVSFETKEKALELLRHFLLTKKEIKEISKTGFFKDSVGKQYYLSERNY